MSDIVITRLLNQIEENKSVTQPPAPPYNPPSNFIPLSIEELKAILSKELGCEEKKEEPTTSELHFDSIYDFVPWYKAQSDKFSPQQRLALDSVELARASIDVGCNCKRASREIRAHQYFEQFWLNNQKNDLLPTIALIANVSKVTVNAYCAYTRQNAV